MGAVNPNHNTISKFLTTTDADLFVAKETSVEVLNILESYVIISKKSFDQQSVSALLIVKTIQIAVEVKRQKYGWNAVQTIDHYKSKEIKTIAKLDTASKTVKYHESIAHKIAPEALTVISKNDKSPLMAGGKGEVFTTEEWDAAMEELTAAAQAYDQMTFNSTKTKGATTTATASQSAAKAKTQTNYSPSHLTASMEEGVLAPQERTSKKASERRRLADQAAQAEAIKKEKEEKRLEKAIAREQRFIKRDIARQAR